MLDLQRSFMGSVVCEWISLANCYLAVSGRALEARDIYRFRRRILADPTRRFTRQDRSHHNRTRHSIQLGYSEAVKSVDHYKHTAGGKHTIIVTCHLMGHLEETTVTVVAEPPIYAQLVTCRTNCGHILWIVGLSIRHRTYASEKSPEEEGTNSIQPHCRFRKL